VHERAGDRDPLALPAGEPAAALADPGVEPRRELLDERQAARSISRSSDQNALSPLTMVWYWGWRSLRCCCSTPPGS
jgi:hypothetical protein